MQLGRGDGAAGRGGAGRGVAHATIKPLTAVKSGRRSGRHQALVDQVGRTDWRLPLQVKRFSCAGLTRAHARRAADRRAADRKRRPLVTLVCRRESRGTTQPKWLEASLLTLTWKRKKRKRPLSIVRPVKGKSALPPGRLSCKPTATQ